MGKRAGQQLRAGQQIYVEMPVAASLDRLWQLTQDPVLHARWDPRSLLAGARWYPAATLAEPV